MLCEKKWVLQPSTLSHAINQGFVMAGPSALARRSLYGCQQKERHWRSELIGQDCRYTRGLRGNACEPVYRAFVTTPGVTVLLTLPAFETYRAGAYAGRETDPRMCL